MNAATIAACTGAKPSVASSFEAGLNATMAEFGIDTPARQAAFLSQIGHESGGLHWLVEIWGPTPAQTRYEGRADLGNTQPGDGHRFLGRGLLQVTGRANYRACGAALGVDLEAFPARLSEPGLAARSAGWFWDSRDLNRYADSGDYERLTRRINGGLNGYPLRLALWNKAKITLGIA